MKLKSPIIIGSDHAAYALKEKAKAFLINFGIKVEDVGVYSENSADYPDYGIKVAQSVSTGKFERGVLLCGTGQGMIMVANKFAHVRAALCHSIFAADMSRRHNDSNILVMGGRVIGEDLAREIIRAWLDTPFEGLRHKERLKKFELLGEHLKA